jgi:hypothetical protein
MLEQMLKTKEHKEGFLIALALFVEECSNYAGERTISAELTQAELIEQLGYAEDHPFMEKLNQLEKHYTFK